MSVNKMLLEDRSSSLTLNNFNANDTFTMDNLVNSSETYSTDL